MQNLTNQQISLFINGVDYTSNIVSISAQTNGETETGLFTTTGTLVLGCNPVSFGSASLDDLVNPDFKQGNLITATYVASGNSVPKVGYALIQRAEYSEENEIVSIFFSDLLAYLNNKRPADVAACFTDDNTLTYGQVIVDLLTSLGIALGNINDVDILAAMPSLIKQNIFLNKEDSFIRVAGNIAYNNGYGLWQDEDGIIQAVRLDQPGIIPIGAKQKQNLQSFQRASSGENVPDILEITGVKLIDAEPVPGSSSYTFPNGVIAPTSDLANFQYYGKAGGAEQYVDRVNRKLYSRKWRRAKPHDALPQVFPNSGFSRINISEIVVNEEYELPPIEPDECVPIDEGRILKRTTTVYEPIAFGLQEFFVKRLALLKEEAREQGLANGDDEATIAAAVEAITIDNITADKFLTIRSQSFSKMITKKTVECWEYNLPYRLELQSEKSLSLNAATLGKVSTEAFDNGYFVNYERTTEEAFGVFFPESADLSLGADTEEIFLTSPLQLFTTEKEERRWNLSPDYQTWTQQSDLDVAAYKIAPEKYFAALEDENIVLIVLLSYITDLVEVITEEPPRGSPPSFARFPALTKPLELPFKTTLTFNGAAQYPVKKTINYDSTSPSKSFAEEQGFGLAKRIAYRSKLHKVTTDLCSVNSTRPFGRYNVYDGKNGRTFSFAIDGSSLAIDQSGGSVLSFNGMLLGFENFNAEAPPLVPEPALNTGSDESYCYTIQVDPTGLNLILFSTECGRIEQTVTQPYTVSGGQAFTPEGTLIPGAVINGDDSFTFTAYLKGGTDSPPISPSSLLGFVVKCDVVRTCNSGLSQVLSSMEANCIVTRNFESFSGNIFGYTVLDQVVALDDSFIIVECG